MTPDQREQLEFIERCDPSFLIRHINEATNFDGKLMERVFELAKEQARTLLAGGESRTEPSSEVREALEMFMSIYRCKGWEGDVAYQRAQAILDGKGKS
ncbi:hypothetical protein [Burkholderia cepacia]|uniref:hypothetical protein n=1 Tax=Burkholderia cepacia TaxID=292 RepID=UPI0015777009|nr:hypothetical protein [Burkholderia cepacia]